eukprot:1910972-Rhodomonas_salina.3
MEVSMSSLAARRSPSPADPAAPLCQYRTSPRRTVRQYRSGPRRTVCQYWTLPRGCVWQYRTSPSTIGTQTAC